MKNLWQLSRVILIGLTKLSFISLAVALWWFEIVPVMDHAAASVIPGFAYSWEFFLSLKGFAAFLIFGIGEVGILLFFMQSASRLASFVCAQPSGGVVSRG